jgi:hypothetical protein
LPLTEGLIMKYFIFTGLIVMILTGCEKETIKSPDTGNITGRVVFDSTVTDAPTSLAGVEVRIIKTNITAYTDTAGEYLFLNIPEGTYSLEAVDTRDYFYGRLDGVEVISGGTRKLPDLKLGIDYLNVPPISISSLILVDSSGNSYDLYYNNYPVRGKNFKIQGIIRIYSPQFQTNYPDTTISMKLNEQPRKTLNTAKGWFSADVILSEGENNFQFWLGTADNPDYTAGPYQVYSVNSINKVSIQLNWSSYSSGGGDAGDFDLHLIDNQTGDSCWYKNPNPDWGYPGATFDDPYLNRDENQNGSSSGSEYLNIYSAPSGSYTIRVYYYTNHSDPLKIIQPTISMQLKDNSTIYLTAPTAMKVGDMWTVSQFSFPDGNILQSVNTIQSGPKQQEEK